MQRGHLEAALGDPFDMVVINSCTVTEAADKECVSTIRSLHKANPSAQIVVTGCLVQRDAGVLRQLPGVRLLAGSNQKHRIAELVATLDPWALEPQVELELDQVYAPLSISSFEGRAKAFVKVQDGCDRSCAFCTIPLVRGRSRSRPLADILEEVRRLLGSGFQEVTLTGVALGLWGKEWDSPQSLSELVEAVDRLPGRFRIRLSSLDPRDLDERLIQTLGSSQKVAHHLHLSLQSGCDPILARMNRGYSSASYRARVDAVRGHWPDLGLTTDVIVGFPGETQGHFEQTVDFCRQMECAKIHVFPYSPRRRTSATFFREPVAPVVVRERARVLRQAADEISAQFRQRFIGTEQEVLVENLEAGSTSQFIKVALSASPGQVGALLPLRIQKFTPQGLFGTFFSSHP